MSRKCAGGIQRHDQHTPRADLAIAADHLIETRPADVTNRCTACPPHNDLVRVVKVQGTRESAARRASFHSYLWTTCVPEPASGRPRAGSMRHKGREPA